MIRGHRQIAPSIPTGATIMAARHPCWQIFAYLFNVLGSLCGWRAVYADTVIPLAEPGSRRIAAFRVVLMFLLLSLFFASPAWAAVTFRAAASGSTSSAGGTIAHIGAGGSATRDNCGSIAPSVSAGSVGDILIAVVVARENGAAVSMPGWNPYFSDSYPGQEFQAFIFWRVATGSDPSTITQSGSCNSLAGQIARFSGVDTANPFETSPILAANWVRQNSGVLDTGTENTTSPTAMLLVAGMITDNRTVNEGAGWNQSFDSSLNISRDTGISLHYELQTSAGAKSISNWDLSGGGNDENYGVIFALRPTPVSGTSLTISVPAGTTAGDVMIASVARTSSAVTLTPPGGWTLIREVTQPSSTSSALATYYRVAGASEPASYTWALSTSGFGGAVGGIASFSGVDSTTPVDAEAGNATASSPSHTAPSVTATLADGMLVTIHEFASSKAWAEPTGMTEMVDVSSLPPNDTNGISMEMNYEVRPTAGATGTRTASPGGPPDSGAVQSISLKPAPLICWSDDFNRPDGPPGSDWVVSNSGGSFGDPVIFNNRLRMTDTAGNLATMALLQRLFPGAGNRIEVEFDHYAYGGSGADGIAITFSDSAVTPAPGAYGGSLGYAQRSTPTVVNGFAGGWLGIGIDEYGNFSNPTEGRQGGPGFRVDSISIRGSGSGTTGYVYHAGTNTLTPQVDNNGGASPPHKYRIIVDHSNAVNAFVSVERDTGAGYVMLVPPYDAKAQAGQAAVPTSWLLSYTGSSGGATNIHEIDSLRICATSQASLSIDHYSISHSGTGVNCQAEPVTITVHDGSHAPVTVSSSTTITLTTSTGLGDWALTSGLGTLNNGVANDGTATYQFGNESSVSLTLKHTTPAPTPGVNINVTDGIVTETSGAATAADDPRLIFASSGFRYTDGTNPVTIGTQIAGKESNITPGAQSLYLQAIRTDTSTGACVGVFPNGTSVNVEMASQCNNPTTCVAGKQVSITNNSITTAIASNPNTSVSSYTSVPLLFGANSQAPLSFNYPDSGSISLHARYNIPMEGGGASPDNMLGSSTAFVVRPFGFRITDPPSGRTGSGDAVFTAAGQNFNTTLTAVMWESADDTNNDGVPDNQSVLSANIATPNFGQETAPATATLSHVLAEPAGGAAGSLTVTAPGFSSFTNGTKTQSVSFGEVGIINFLATTTNYLGSGQNITAGTNGLTGVGRFTPSYFDVTRSHGCGSFTYSGQPLALVTATARAVGGTKTDNYHNFGGGIVFSKDTTISDAGSTANFTNNVMTAVDFVNGIQNKTDVTYTFAAKRTPPIMLNLRAIDTDTVSSAGHLEDSAAIRSGRLHLYNAYGSELMTLSLPMKAEYYEDTTGPPATTGWITNGADACTALAVGQLDLQNDIDNPAQGVNTILIQPGRPSNVTVVSPTAGVGELSFSAPGDGGDGFADARMDLTTMPWLRYDWDDTGSLDDPSGRASFGLYRGSPRHIYQRQRYN